MDCHAKVTSKLGGLNISRGNPTAQLVVFHTSWGRDYHKLVPVFTLNTGVGGAAMQVYENCCDKCEFRLAYGNLSFSKTCLVCIVSEKQRNTTWPKSEGASRLQSKRLLTTQLAPGA